MKMEIEINENELKKTGGGRKRVKLRRESVAKRDKLMNM